MRQNYTDINNSGSPYDLQEWAKPSAVKGKKWEM